MEMAAIFRRHRRDFERSAAVTGEEAPTNAAAGPALAFEPPKRAAAPPARDRTGGTAPASTPSVRADAERGDAPELARLREELSRERAEKAQALDEAERRLVRALAEQRAEMEEEVREHLAEVEQLREELARERTELQAELAAIRRQRSEAEPHIAAVVQPSARAAHG